MDRKDFGQLVSTLRKEIRNEFDEAMTQSDLAELARVPLITLQKIEQGRQENIKPEILLKLAQALTLPSRTRQVFFLASLGLKDSETMKPTATPEAVLPELLQILSQIQAPAFILDGFGDIVALNPSGTAIFNLEPGQLQAAQLLTEYNFIRFMFSPEFEPLRGMLGETQFSFSRRTVLLFRLWTMKSRNHWYFQRILPELNRYPEFRHHWQSPPFPNEDIFAQYNQFTLAHPELGRLKFLSHPIQALTTHGDLILFSLQPLDAHTAEVCLQLARKLGTEAIRLAPWPKPPVPPDPFTVA